jgi:hypothetical protein
MKSEILMLERKNEKKSVYPYLGKYKSLIVLFHKKHCGTVMANDNMEEWEIGEYFRGWDESVFTPLPPEQKVVLSNQ